MADCRICANFDWCLENEDCGLFKPKPLTNADKYFRNATDVEIARFFKEDETPCPPSYKCYLDKSCEDCWLDWLKQEVEDGQQEKNI